MTKEEMKKQQRLAVEALAFWCNQWTDEFLEEHVFPYMDKFLDNNICVHHILKWYKEHTYYNNSRIGYLKLRINQSEFIITPIKNSTETAYNEVIYDIFKNYKVEGK